MKGCKSQKAWRGTGKAEDAKSQSRMPQRHLPKRNWECRGCEKPKPKSHQKSHKPTRSRKAKKPRSQEAKKLKTQEAKSGGEKIQKTRKTHTPPRVWHAFYATVSLQTPQKTQEKPASLLIRINAAKFTTLHVTITLPNFQPPSDRANLLESRLPWNAPPKTRGMAKEKTKNDRRLGLGPSPS